jgi:glutamine amidotransferase PdxT
MASFSSAPVVGIFAIQGAVSEHSDCVKKCGGIVKEVSFHSPLLKLISKFRTLLPEILL